MLLYSLFIKLENIFLDGLLIIKINRIITAAAMIVIIIVTADIINKKELLVVVVDEFTTFDSKFELISDDSSGLFFITAASAYNFALL